MTTFARISKEVEFDAGHRVPSHGSKCRSPHGHRYRVRATCEGAIVDEPGAPDDGMLIDFSGLKTMLTELVHDPWDHAMLVHHEDGALLTAMRGHGWKVVITPHVPTAENLARMIWAELAPAIEAHWRGGLVLAEVAVWETPTSVAYFTGGARG